MIKFLKQINYLTIILLFQLVATSVSAKLVVLNNLKVTKVIDGDTIWVKDLKNNYFKIRLLGINATEISTIPKEPFSIEAKNELERILNNETIYAKYDTENKKDKFNRLLAQIYRKNDNMWVNAYLVSKGLAYVYIISNNILYLSKLIEIENSASNLKLNLWNNNNYSIITAKEAVLFKGKYKSIIGTVKKINVTKKNIWLEITENANTENSNYVLAVKVNKKLFVNKYNWQTLLNRPIKIRGYIEQYKADLLPFVRLVNLHTIEILNKI